MLCINGNIPYRPLNEDPKFPDLKLIVFKLHQIKRKCCLRGIYEPPFQNDIKFINRKNLTLDHYLIA